jgi:hypothetical protein
LVSLINFSEVLGGRAGQSASGDGFRDGFSGHERVLKNLIESGSFGGIKDKDSLNEFSCFFRDGDMIGEAVLTGLDFFVGGLDFGGFEWGFAD